HPGSLSLAFLFLRRPLRHSDSRCRLTLAQAVVLPLLQLVLVPAHLALDLVGGLVDGGVQVLGAAFAPHEQAAHGIRDLRNVRVPFDAQRHFDRDVLPPGEKLVELGHPLFRILPQSRRHFDVFPLDRHSHRLAVCHDTTPLTCDDAMGALLPAPVQGPARAASTLSPRGVPKLALNCLVTITSEARASHPSRGLADGTLDPGRWARCVQGCGGAAAFRRHSGCVLRGCMLHMRPRSMRTHVDGQHRGEMRESTARAGMHGCSRPDRSTKLPTNERLPTKKLQLPADLVFAPTLACWS